MAQSLDPLCFSDFHLHPDQTNQSLGHIPSLSWVGTFTSEITYTSHADSGLLFLLPCSFGYSFHSCFSSPQPPTILPKSLNHPSLSLLYSSISSELLSTTLSFHWSSFLCQEKVPSLVEFNNKDPPASWTDATR